jgi:hypothetical protein
MEKPELAAMSDLRTESFINRQKNCQAAVNRIHPESGFVRVPPGGKVSEHAQTRSRDNFRLM